MSAYEQLMALKTNGKTEVKTESSTKSSITTTLGSAVNNAGRAGERVLAAVKFTPELFQAGRLAVREEVASELLAIINRK